MKAWRMHKRFTYYNFSLKGYGEGIVFTGFAFNFYTWAPRVRSKTNRGYKTAVLQLLLWNRVHCFELQYKKLPDLP